MPLLQTAPLLRGVRTLAPPPPPPPRAHLPSLSLHPLTTVDHSEVRSTLLVCQRTCEGSLRRHPPLRHHRMAHGMTSKGKRPSGLHRLRHPSPRPAHAHATPVTALHSADSILTSRLASVSRQNTTADCGGCGEDVGVWGRGGGALQVPDVRCTSRPAGALQASFIRGGGYFGQDPPTQLWTHPPNF